MSNGDWSSLTSASTHGPTTSANVRSTTSAAIPAAGRYARPVAISVRRPATTPLP